MKKIIISLLFLSIFRLSSNSQAVTPSVTTPVVTPPQRLIPDTIHLIFRLGTNFDFMNNNLSFNKVYGQLRYYDENVAPIRGNVSYGFDLGGSRSNSLSVVRDSFISHNSFIDPINPSINADTLRILNQVVRSKQSQSFGQLSLFFNPFVTYNLNKNHQSMALRLGIGLYGEMYRVNSYLKYTDTSVIKQDTGRVAKTTRFIPTNFRDSTGSTYTYGYFGVSFSTMLYTEKAIVKFRAVFGKVVTGGREAKIGSRYNPPGNLHTPEDNKFYLIDASITEPHSKISIEGNIRGLFPNHTPVWSIYATKAFDLAKIFEALVH